MVSDKLRNIFFDIYLYFYHIIIISRQSRVLFIRLGQFDSLSPKILGLDKHYQFFFLIPLHPKSFDL